jgi:hypothetical protein
VQRILNIIDDTQIIKIDTEAAKPDLVKGHRYGSAQKKRTDMTV